MQDLPDKEQNIPVQQAPDLLDADEEEEEEKEWDAIVNKPGFLEKMEKLMWQSLASGIEDGGFCP